MFQSTPPHGRRLGLKGESRRTRIVSIHAPVRSDPTIFNSLSRILIIPPTASIASPLSTRLQQNSRQPLQFLITRIELKSAGIQSRNAEQRLRAFIPIRDRTTDDLSLKLDFGDGYVQGDGLSVRKHVFAAAPRFESDRFEVRPRHERVEHAGIDEEFAGPASLRVRRIADGYVNIDRAHCGSPFELVLLP